MQWSAVLQPLYIAFWVLTNPNSLVWILIVDKILLYKQPKMENVKNPFISVRLPLCFGEGSGSLWKCWPGISPTRTAVVQHGLVGIAWCEKALMYMEHLRVIGGVQRAFTLRAPALAPTQRGSFRCSLKRSKVESYTFLCVSLPTDGCRPLAQTLSWLHSLFPFWLCVPLPFLFPWNIISTFARFLCSAPLRCEATGSPAVRLSPCHLL